jgi:hypothetical protein
VCRERPLAGCRLSRETDAVGLPVRWPWSPSLPAPDARVGPPFDGRAVLRDHPTPLVSSPSRLSFRVGYRLRGSREASSGKHTELRTDAVAYTPVCPTDIGFAAVGQLTAGSDASAALRVRSVRYCIVRLLPDAPSRAARTRRPCLVDGGFPPSGPQEDLTTTCRTSLFCVHAEHTHCRALRALRGAPASPPAPKPERVPTIKRDSVTLEVLGPMQSDHSQYGGGANSMRQSSNIPK